jgi:hypothetical protein
MNKLKRIKITDWLEKAEERVLDKKATIQYSENGFPRQKQFASHTEEDLFEQIFWFQAEHYPKVVVNIVQYNGSTIKWNGYADTYAHYWLGKGRMSFEDFKAACLNEPQIA